MSCFYYVSNPNVCIISQTHSTPVLLGFKDRAELATADMKCVSTVLEGFVIVQKSENNDVAVDESKMDEAA